MHGTALDAEAVSVVLTARMPGRGTEYQPVPHTLPARTQWRNAGPMLLADDSTPSPMTEPVRMALAPPFTNRVRPVEPDAHHPPVLADLTPDSDLSALGALTGRAKSRLVTSSEQTACAS